MTVTLHPLTAGDSEALEQVRQYFRNYAAWLGVDLSYQNFDQEMASLPGAYTAPEGRLFFAEVDGRPAGCVGVRPLPDSEGVCEMKRLYVTPEERGHGVGAALALAAIKAAKEIGYRKLIIDTLPSMRMAVKLYRELGFTEAPSYRAILILAVETGMRQAAILGLTRQEVDLKLRRIVLGNLSGERTKTSESRIIPLTPRAWQALTDTLCTHRAPFVFLGRRWGRPMRQIKIVSPVVV